jgi:hypothetical protein
MKQTIELHRQRIPRRLLFIDALGAVLAAIGVLELLKTGPQLVPDALRFPGAGVALIVIGSIVMLAVPAWLLREHRRRHAYQRDRHHA